MRACACACMHVCTHVRGGVCTRASVDLRLAQLLEELINIFDDLLRAVYSYGLIVMTYIVRVWKVMAYIVMAYIGMDYIVMTYTVMVNIFCDLLQAVKHAYTRAHAHVYTRDIFPPIFCDWPSTA